MADSKWPAEDNRALIGKRISRIDGPWKSSGTAKYSYRHQPSQLAVRQDGAFVRTRTRKSTQHRYQRR